MPKIKQKSKQQKPKQQIPMVYEYFVKSVDADRAIIRFGKCKRGEWVRVPENVYNDIQNAILEGEKSGVVVGWKTKKEYEKLEVIQ